ncbi:MAG: gamma carbonic anhydrase family protein [Chloroflexota bacterium]
MPLHPYHGTSPEVHPTAWIAPGAHVIGDVTIGEGSGIWFGAVIRGDDCSISIGRFSNVQDNSVIHVESANRGADRQPTVIGDYVTLGHAVLVHGCTIEDRVLVGMGAVVMNGATIGSDTVVGARALIPERRGIPSRSLAVGMPAKVVRTLEDDEVLHIRYAAEHYAELLKAYR